MEKLLEIVGSLIPEEQKDDVKSKIDGVLKERDITLKKDLSKKYKVDLFSNDVEKAYTNTNFIQTDKFNEVKTLNDKLAQDLEELKEKRIKLEQEKELLDQERKMYDSSIKLVGTGFNVDRLHLVKGELIGEPDKDVETIKERYPELFLSGKDNKKIFPNEDPKPKKTDFELYLEKRKK